MPLFRLVMLAITVLPIAGCARFPEDSTPKVVQTITFKVTLNGPVNLNYHYFVAIDMFGGNEGPKPLFPTVPGQPWLTSQDPAKGGATHFVEFYQGRFTVYQIINLAEFQYQSLGSPLRSEYGTNYFSCTLDLLAISPIPPTSNIDVNFINTDYPFDLERFIDGLGPIGGDYVNVDITSSRTFSNADTGYIEQAGDVLDRNRMIQAPSAQINPLDISDWSISTEINN
ncbi:MAG: hypothetical protein WCT06_03290 [Armatimonadota bacterium]